MPSSCGLLVYKLSTSKVYKRVPDGRSPNSFKMFNRWVKSFKRGCEEYHGANEMVHKLWHLFSAPCSWHNRSARKILHSYGFWEAYSFTVFGLCHKITGFYLWSDPFVPCHIHGGSLSVWPHQWGLYLWAHRSGCDSIVWPSLIQSALFNMTMALPLSAGLNYNANIISQGLNGLVYLFYLFIEVVSKCFIFLSMHTYIFLTSVLLMRTRILVGMVLLDWRLI